MKISASIGLAVLTLHCAHAVANTPRTDKEPDPDFWKDCSGTDLRCVQRDAMEIDCTFAVTFRRISLSDGGEIKWYASSRNGGGNATPQELYAYKNSVTLPIALDLYATWEVDEVNKCQVDAFVRCHLSPRAGLVGGEADACRQWAAAFASKDRNGKLGTCTSKNGVSLYRTVNGVGDCKWTPPRGDRENFIDISANDIPISNR